MVWFEEKVNDNKEFCSENCCRTYYKDACTNCFRLNASYDWNNISTNDKELVEYLETKLNKKINKDYNKKWCFACFQEECGVSEAMKNWTNIGDDYGKWRKKQKGKGGKVSQSLINDNSQITTLEEEQILQYFTKNNINSIKLSNNKLLIKYNHKEEEEEEPKTTELQQIKDYIQKQPTNTLTLNDLEKKDNSSNSSVNAALYWGIGIVSLLILLLTILFWREIAGRES